MLDTNVWLAALFTRGLCEAVLDVCVQMDEFVIVTSEYIVDEFARNARAKFGAPPPAVDAAVAFLRQISELIEPATMPASACSDPADRPVLGTAVAGGADFVVTGDAALLALKSVSAIAIVSPREFYERFFRVSP